MKNILYTLTATLGLLSCEPPNDDGSMNRSTSETQDTPSLNPPPLINETAEYQTRAQKANDRVYEIIKTLALETH